MIRQRLEVGLALLVYDGVVFDLLHERLQKGPRIEVILIMKQQIVQAALEGLFELTRVEQRIE